VRPAILLMGPTASGKSALAMALAQRFGGEIVSVDSAQVYRGMDIGTAKPSRDEQAAVPHHLLDLLDPTQAYSAAMFVRDAQAAVAGIRARGRLPIVAGGTMLYFKALQQGLSALPVADPAVRADLDAQAARDGWPALHTELARIDPVTAARLPPTDSQRIQRALEVFRVTGQPLSALQGHRANTSALPGATIALALVPGDRAALHAAIARRFDTMLAQGLVEEVRALRERFDLSPELPSMRCVGYRQAWNLLDGAINVRDLREQGIAATRQLAKRQLTWLRSTVAETLDPWHGDALAWATAKVAAADTSGSV
jgi:tRNA dimethylallyltransferase